MYYFRNYFSGVQYVFTVSKFLSFRLQRLTEVQVLYINKEDMTHDNYIQIERCKIETKKPNERTHNCTDILSLSFFFILPLIDKIKIFF